jgi:hypothetical protein
MKFKNISLEDFYILCQELYETAGNSCQLDEDFINLLYQRIGKYLSLIKNKD